MTYKAVQPHTKEEADMAFSQGTSAEITDALLGVTYYVEDWRWVQTACLSLLERPDIQCRWIAIQCLGHLATFHKKLDLNLVLPALRVYESHPKLRIVVSNAFDDIMAIDDNSYYAEKWDELPQGIRQRLIENGIFTSRGKLVWRLFRRPVKYKPPTKQEANIIFSQGTKDQIIETLSEITSHEKDWRWVQSSCLSFLDASDTDIQLTAIDCLEKLARIRRKLDVTIVLPALRAHASNPALTEKILDTFLAITEVAKHAPGLVKNWDKLPHPMKEILIKEGAFDSNGKYIKKKALSQRFFGR